MLAKCKALLLLPMDMATNPPVSPKLHCFCIVSYLANLTVVPYVALLFSKSIGWTVKNVVVSSEGQAAHKALRQCFSNSVLHHIYCTEVTFTFALAIQEKMNIPFRKTVIKGTIFAFLLELLTKVIGCNSIFMGY